MRRKRRIGWGHVILAACCASIGSITPPPAQAAPKKTAKMTSPKRKAGYAVGRVLDMAGKPLPGAEVGIYGTTMAGANTRFEATTNAQGMFSQRLPEGIYGLSAYYKTRFNGKNYNFTLEPTDGVTAAKHDSAPGIVKTFVWKIAGLKIGQVPGESGTHTEPRKYYGGFVYLTSKEEGFGGKVYFPAGSKLSITMTPRGKLIDGRTAKPKLFQRAFDKDITSGLSWHLVDVPIGLYSLSAQLTQPDGTKKPLGVKRSLDFQGAFSPSVNVDFEPTQFGDMQMMQITVEP